MRVLIVEDEPYMAEAIRDGLRLEAIAADIAGDGDIALELLSVIVYDIAVLDRDIPGPSGDEIANRIIASGSGSPNPGSSPPWPASATASTLHQAPGVRERTVDRRPGLSARLKLTLSYAGFLMLAGAVLLAVGYFSLSRGVHPGVIFMVRSHADLLRAFAPTAAIVLAFLLVFGLVGGWLLAGRMLAPLTRITDATRIAANGSLSRR